MSRRPGVGIARREGMRGFGGGGSVPLTLSGLALLSNTNFYSVAASGPALATTCAIGVVYRKITAGNILREYRIHRFTTGVRGYRYQPVMDGVTSRTTTTMVSGAPANVAEQNTYSPTQNKVQRMLFTRTASGLTHYRNGALMSAATAIVGYTAPTTENFEIIATAATDEVEIVSISIADTSDMDAAAALAWDNQVKAGGSRRVPNATHHWEASEAGATWVDQISGLSLTRSGSPVVRTFTADFE